MRGGPAKADALDIKAQAKRRLADEYDAAQERGEVGKHGGARNQVSATETWSAQDIVPAKALHEARQVRDAEAANPGVVRRALDEKLAAGQEPTRAVIRDRNEMLSLTDMWKASGSDPQKAPAKWRALPGTKGFVDHVEVTIGKSDSELFKTVNGGKSPGTWAHWQIGLAYARRDVRNGRCDPPAPGGDGEAYLR